MRSVLVPIDALGLVFRRGVAPACRRLVEGLVGAEAVVGGAVGHISASSELSRQDHRVRF